HTRSDRDWSSDVCSSDLGETVEEAQRLMRADLARAVQQHARARVLIGEGKLQQARTSAERALAGIERACGETSPEAALATLTLEIGRASCKGKSVDRGGR